MARKGQAYVPSMSDAAVKAKTGKNWAGWFDALDQAGAAKLDHRAIADILSEKHGLPGWWCQMVTVEYERARGLRVPHETTSGFSVAISKTIATSLPDLYEATANAAKRKKWFPRGRVRAVFADEGQILSRLLEQERAARDRLLREGRRQGADRRAGEQACQESGCRA